MRPLVMHAGGVWSGHVTCKLRSTDSHLHALIGVVGAQPERVPPTHHRIRLEQPRAKSPRGCLQLDHVSTRDAPESGRGGLSCVQAVPSRRQR